jgi:hypothetical protein
MKKIHFVLLAMIFFSISVFLIQGLHYNDATLKETDQEDKAISVVKEYWENSISEKDVNNIFTSPPQSFFDETSRCLKQSGEDSTDKRSPKLNLDNQNEFLKGLEKTSEKIQKENLNLLSLKIERKWENEAIVEAEYVAPKTPYVNQKRYFFLYKINNDWKIFFDAGVLTIFNKEYAKYECSK